MKLDKELIELIVLDYLDLSDQLRCRAVCKGIKEIVGDFAVEEYSVEYPMVADKAVPGGNNAQLYQL